MPPVDNNKNNQHGRRMERLFEAIELREDTTTTSRSSNTTTASTATFYSSKTGTEEQKDNSPYITTSPTKIISSSIIQSLILQAAQILKNENNAVFLNLALHLEERALALCKEYSAKPPNISEFDAAPAHISIAETLRMMWRFNEAIDHYNAALQIYYNNNRQPGYNPAPIHLALDETCRMMDRAVFAGVYSKDSQAKAHSNAFARTVSIKNSSSFTIKNLVIEEPKLLRNEHLLRHASHLVRKRGLAVSNNVNTNKKPPFSSKVLDSSSAPILPHGGFMIPKKDSKKMMGESSCNELVIDHNKNDVPPRMIYHEERAQRQDGIDINTTPPPILHESGAENLRITETTTNNDEAAVVSPRTSFTTGTGKQEDNNTNTTNTTKIESKKTSSSSSTGTEQNVNTSTTTNTRTKKTTNNPTSTGRTQRKEDTTNLVLSSGGEEKERLSKIMVRCGRNTSNVTDFGNQIFRAFKRELCNSYEHEGNARAKKRLLDAALDVLTKEGFVFVKRNGNSIDWEKNEAGEWINVETLGRNELRNKLAQALRDDARAFKDKKWYRSDSAADERARKLVEHMEHILLACTNTKDHSNDSTSNRTKKKRKISIRPPNGLNSASRQFSLMEDKRKENQSMSSHSQNPGTSKVCN